MTHNPVLEIFSDYVWPWCYFITGRIEKLTREYEIDVRWRAFPLHPETPEEGMTLQELFGNQPVDFGGVLGRLRSTAADLGLPFRGNDRIYNTRLAQELGLWAESKGKGSAYHSAVFKAYFVENRNIARIPQLVELAESVGLPTDEAEEIMIQGTFKAAADEDWAISRALRITAVPTCILNENRMVGAKPYEMYESLMQANTVKKRAATK